MDFLSNLCSHSTARQGSPKIPSLTAYGVTEAAAAHMEGCPLVRTLVFGSIHPLSAALKQSNFHFMHFETIEFYCVACLFQLQ